MKKFNFNSHSLAILTVAALLFCCTQSGQAQSQAMQEAQKYFNAQDWPQAEQAFKAITESQPENGRAWLFLGAALHNQEKFHDAIAAYAKADALGFSQPRARYNLACSQARLGEIDASFAWLEKAMQAGFSQVNTLKTDKDLQALRTDTRFAEIVQKADQNARPCEYNPDCRAFDFWIGEWEVFMPGGQKAGENIIKKTLNGCMLMENWTGIGGSIGKSMNYFDPATKKWKQLWVDGAGGHMSYGGVFTDGALKFEGYQIQGNGRKGLFKMAFTPQENGDVRQYIEQSLDGGKTYNVWFDGMYKKKKATDGAH
ncbi:MAG: type IV pilus biogenesis/stability protein PilW [bacterium]